jgi:hypothetical protein
VLIRLRRERLAKFVANSPETTGVGVAVARANAMCAIARGIATALLRTVAGIATTANAGIAGIETVTVPGIATRTRGAVNGTLGEIAIERETEAATATCLATTVAMAEGMVFRIDRI